MSVPRGAGISAADSWQGYRYLADNAIDVVLEATLETEITWISPSVEETLGWEPEELVGRSAAFLVHVDDLPVIMELAEAINTEGARVRTTRCRMLAKDGSYKNLQLRGRPALDEHGAIVGHIITFQDTTERDDALRALAVLSGGNRVLSRVDNETQLLREMCQTITEVGQYPLAWYGRRILDADQSIEQTAAAGEAIGYLESLHVSWGDGALGVGPTGTAIRTATTQVRADVADDPSFSPWLEAARAAGLSSSIALPVTVDGEVDGALMVYAGEANAFDEQAQELLETLASDLGLGLHRLRSVEALRARTREAQEQRARLAESEARYRLLAENSSDVVWQTDGHGRIIWASDSCRQVLGYPASDLLGGGPDLAHPDDADTVAEARASLAAGLPAEGELRLRRSDGRWLWMAFQAHSVTAAGATSHVITLRNVDDEVTVRNALATAVGSDPLTGLAARPAMLQRLKETLDRLGNRRLAAVLCVGVDRLSAINDAFTHAAGDLVLTSIATRIVQAVGTADVVGRGAGVEFLVIVDDLASPDQAAILGDRLLARAKGRVTIGDHHLEPTVSIGIAIGDHRSDPEQLVRDASVAMGQAKAEGRDRYAFADASLADQARRRLDVEASVRDGLQHDRFLPYFQPIVDLADGRLTGYESLVRHLNDDGTVSPPARFMAVAELSPLVCDIDMAMLRRCLAVLSVLPDEHTVAVNLSTVTLARPGYAHLIADLIRESEINRSRLHLEVTETALLGDTAQVVETMEQVAALGVGWYVDDFGTGFSSISHLRDLPISGIKLDVSFSAGVRRGDVKSIRLAQALAGLAGGLALDTVAEGIETTVEAEILREHGWRHGQGWLFGRPAPSPDNDGERAGG